MPIVIVAQVEDGAVDHAVMCPEAGLAIADKALVGVDADQQEFVHKKGRDLFNLHCVYSDGTGAMGKRIAFRPGFTRLKPGKGDCGQTGRSCRVFGCRPGSIGSGGGCRDGSCDHSGGPNAAR